MADDTASASLHHVLEHRSEKVHKPRSAVLFRHGEKASGMFAVLSGKVSWDVGVDAALARTCGPGAFVGLPSTPDAAPVQYDRHGKPRMPLDSLLRTHPELCQPLLAILGAVIAENHEVERARQEGSRIETRLEMRSPMEDKFETLESAYDFVALLAETVAEAKRELESDAQRESASNPSRRLDALRMAQYNVGKLELHVNRTKRILNDLRTLRRLLFQERGRISETQSATAQHARHSVRLPLGSLGDGTQSRVSLQESHAA